MRYVLLHTPTWRPASAAPALEAAQIDVREVRLLRDLAVDERPTVLVLDAESRSILPLDVLRAFVDAGGAIVALGRDGEPDVPTEMPSELLSGFVRHPVGVRQLLVAVRAGFREAAARAETARARAEAASRGREIGELTRIGVALGTERDLDTLLDLILTQSRRITSSDAGSLYLIEGEPGEKRLRFRLAQTYSKPEAPFVEFTMPMDRTSLAGYAAVTGEPLVIDDAYFLPPDVEYTINRSFDERYGYRTKSMLVIPMKDHKEQVIGVLQLINRKRSLDAVLATPAAVEQQVVPFSKRTVELVTALAGQAAVAIENSQLYREIERLFEGFVQAAVRAIEQRDPTTFGHSGRVANMTVSLAAVVDKAGDGPYSGLTFTREQLREIRYAGLLHDFGKVGVREQVLVKAKKLYPLQLELIRQRHDFVRRSAEREFWRKRAEFLETHGRQGYEPFVRTLEAEHARELTELERFMKAVLHANEPTVLPATRFEELLDLARRTYQDLAGAARPYLTDDEVRYLTIPKGSLDEAERLEIESHVNHTYNFLKEIPWTRELQHIPLIAYGHHEKLDGGGYPRGVTGEAIPIQTRMMTISDIYDALTAADRPYKPAVARARALDIMDDEVRAGQLDRELFRLFVDAKVFETNA
ncbi:MAG: HD family phosphohydrolase [Gemmatimonadetes bacterium]|nr:MAG: HD family phosphohydrolase [Gemmatimonadota bacterium]PYP28353.1 MAG: HD family phosphohydrolase [Gemmatimonadota bacterium]